MAGYTPQLGRQFAIQAAQKYGLDPRIFTAQLQQESGFRADAVSPVGARGPGQIMPATWRDPGFGLSFKGDINDPYANIEASAQYQRKMLDRYDGNQAKALAAYNWGAGNADKWSGDPSALPDETRNYLSRILGNNGDGGAGDVLSLASRNGPVTIADEAFVPEEEPRSIMQQVKEGAQFHGGNALQSLGAAIAATSLGESAAPQLGQIRDQYFAEQEAEFAKKQAEQQRIAMIDMVGADSEFGQALANGADPQAVLQAYMQAQGFGHDRAMAEQGFGYQSILQDDAQQHSYGMQQSEFGQQERMADINYGYERAGAREDNQYTIQRDEAAHGRALDELHARAGYDRANMDYAADIETRKATEAGAASRSARENLREGYAMAAERTGTPADGDLIRSLPDEIFDSPESAREYMEQFVGPDVAKDAEAYTLSPGQTRFDANNNPVASVAPAPDDRYRPVTPDELKAAGIPLGDGKAYQVNEATGKIEPIGGSGVTVNNSTGGQESEYNKKRGGAYAEQAAAMQQGGRAATAELAQIRAMRGELASGVYTGFGGDWVNNARRLGGALGIGDAEKLQGGELIQVIQNRLALGQRSTEGGGGMPGAMSDADRQFLVNSVPGLLRDPGSNAKILGYMEAVAQREVEVANMANAYELANGQLDAGFDRQLAEYVNANPLFSNGIATGTQPAANGVTPGGFKIRAK